MREIHHNTDAQVRDYLSQALAIIEALDPPADLRAPCFQLAAQWLAAKSITGPPSGIVPSMAIPRGH